MNAPAVAETTPWNVPNALTAFRILLVPVFAWMQLSHPDDPWWRFWTAVVFLVAILTEMATFDEAGVSQRG